ncbi:MAG: hypothetical protein KAS21_05915 [Candidatus Aminicenantes bacterium]|nr:hypothetical protein [Candidatus Aminicenantes bacterium]
MDIFNDDMKNIIGDHNALIESVIPETIPSAGILMEKRKDRNKYYFKAGRLGLAYILLFVVFTSFSLFIVNSSGSSRDPDSNAILNAGIFSSENPGSLVSAFRETVK